MTNPNRNTQPIVFSTKTLKKLFLSSLVVVTFIAYTVRERLNGTDNLTSANPTPTTNTQSKTPQNTVSNNTSATTINAAASSTYRDGQFTGDITDAYWGNVEVQAVIQSGKITDVQFLDYPHDRRTSAFINSQAMPWLTNEAIQAQSARVNIISGATLTSEAFIHSLQSALNKAKNV